jgi:DNA-binding IclR family transcriptional regulator
MPEPLVRTSTTATHDRLAPVDGSNGTAPAFRPSPAAERDDPGVRSVVRALDLLTFFDENHRGRGVRELARAAGLPKTTVLRLVQTLEQYGMLWTRPDGQLAVGPGLLRWARLARDAWQLPEPAYEAMRELSAQTGETVNVFVRHGLVRVCIAQQEGSQALRHVVRIGDELPLWGGATGYVLLIDAQPDMIDAVARTSPQGSAFIPTLRERVQAAATAGWAQSHGEREAGAASVAAPLLTPRGRVVAALTLAGPTSRFTPECVARFAPAVVHTAQRISCFGLAWAGSDLA